jgi:hypothetical protein
VLVLAVAVAIAGLMVPAAQRATAAPAQDWISVSDLEDLLAATPNGIPGHFTTVLGGSTLSQQEPVDLPLTVLSVIPDAGPAGDLVLVSLDLTNPDMARIGNIAAGMSGSPVVIATGGSDKVVGALSYGDIFTTNGLALATPIEDMLAVEDAGLAAARPAAASPRRIPPVRVDGTTISRIFVTAPGATKVRSNAGAATDPGTAYFTPLLGLQISGLPVKSSSYSRLESGALRHGLRVLAPHGGRAAGRSADFEPEIVPGASAGTFYSLGALNVGAVGTVTYTTADQGLVAFGHPLLWTGPSDAFFTSAWIEGMWTSTLSSYKLGSPGRVLGSLVQDRGAGVGARLDQEPVPVPVRATATVTAGGPAVTRTAETLVAPGTFATDMRSDLPAAAATQPIFAAADISSLPGSAKTDMTIVLSDGARDHTIHRTNLYDDEYDVQGAPGQEVYGSLEAVLSNPEGIAPATVKSIELTTEVSSTRERALLAGIYAPNGLRAGRNTLSVAIKPYRSTTEQRVPVTLTLPPGMPVNGVVKAVSGQDADVQMDDSSLAGIVAGLNGAPANSDIVVEFRPDGSDQAGPRGIAHTSTVISGELEAATSSISVEPSATRIVAGQKVALSGSVRPVPVGATVMVQRRTVGSSTWRTVRRAVSLDVLDDEGTFEVSDRPQLNSVYRISYAGSNGLILGSSADRRVTVRGRLVVSGAATTNGFALKAAITPKVAGATVTFQRLRAGKWHPIKVVKTGSTGQARVMWRVAKGTYQVRAVLTGTPEFAGNISRTVRLHR